MLILNEEKYAKSIYDGKNEEEKSILSKVGYITRYLLYVENKNDDEKTIDINTAKPILKAAKWVLESKLMEPKFSNDTNSIKELSLLIASFDSYINKL